MVFFQIGLKIGFCSLGGANFHVNCLVMPLAILGLALGLYFFRWLLKKSLLFYFRIMMFDVR